MARAVLFDIDGTLVDSVDLHAQAWQEALARFGKEVPYAAIRSQIGTGGNRLVAAFLSDEEQQRFGEELSEQRAALFQRQYLPRVKPFPEARELLARLKQGGVLVGLASSCARSELGYYLRMVGGAKLVDAATTGDDTGRSKPVPEVFDACLDRLGIELKDAVGVADSPFDVEAAGRAGLATVGVLCGGFEEAALLAAGCVAVYQDPRDILARLPQTPLAPEPQPGQHR